MNAIEATETNTTDDANTLKLLLRWAVSVLVVNLHDDDDDDDDDDDNVVLRELPSRHLYHPYHLQHQWSPFQSIRSLMSDDEFRDEVYVIPHVHAPIIVHTQQIAQ